MILDSSALVAMLRVEDEATEFAGLVHSAGSTSVSAATYLEASIVLTETLHPRLDELLQRAATHIVAVDAEQVRVARAAFTRFGKGSGSRARLNFGDCFSYALAKTLDQPLLFKGEDFTHTDVTPAVTP